MIRALTLFASLAFAAFAGGAVLAQNLFAPRLLVNDRVISGYEVQQRVQMLRLFRAPGDIEAEAMKGLIEDRLRMSAAKQIGLAATSEQVLAGMEEFASRANLTAEQFIQALGQAGVSAETFRDFVEAGLIWREVVRQKFGPSTNITEAEVDRAITQGAGGPGLRVLVAEIVIPAPAGSEGSAMALARRLQVQIKTESDFGAAAREHSGSATAGSGGRLAWMPLSNLPPAVSAIILGLRPGQTSAPVNLGETIGLFQLRGVEELQGGAGGGSVEYAQFLLPNDTNAAAEAARIRAKVDSCNDLYAVAKGLPADRLLRETQSMSQVPADIGLQLARLDANETADFPRGGAHVVLMLCARNPQGENSPSREVVREQLLNQRLAAQADIYLEQLRANAFIREP